MAKFTSIKLAFPRTGRGEHKDCLYIGTQTRHKQADTFIFLRTFPKVTELLRPKAIPFLRQGNINPSSLSTVGFPDLSVVAILS